jgi:anti-anti-sigma factor
VLDPSGVGFCDSCGIRTLAEARQIALDEGTAFRLAAPSEAVIRVLELAGALEAFDIVPDVETALKD